MKRISVDNEWSKLEEVFLGIAGPSYVYGLTPISLEPSRPWRRRVWQAFTGTMLTGRRIPTFIQAGYARELTALENVLLERGIRVRRPKPIRPFPEEPPGLTQMFSRDVVMAIGDLVIRGRQRDESGNKDLRGFAPALNALAKDGTRIVSVPTERRGLFLEGGDVLVDKPYVFVGVGKYGSSVSGAEWLAKQLGKKWRVVPVPIVDPGILHLDTCLTLIGPKRGIVHRPSLAAPLPAPLDAYDLIDVDAKTRRELGTNVLVLDPKTVVMQARHRDLRAKLAGWGFHVIPLDFHRHAGSGGAFRCTTAPLCRSK